MAKRKRWTIEDMQGIAKERGGQCLSATYVNSTTRLRWRCAEGHEWEAIPTNVRVSGRWCPKCANKNRGAYHRLTIEQMYTVAKERDGQCLSTTYVNSTTKLRWRCADGHEWEAIPISVKRGSWCPTCADNTRSTRADDQRLRIEQMYALAKERDGECLSTTYVNSGTKLRWRCADGHEWEAKPYNIKLGKWCPTCAGNEPLTIEQMQSEAEKRGGQCLSSTYVNIGTKLRWCCADGHEWEMKASHVKSGHWCPTCSQGNTERIVRDICEQMFGASFPKNKPRWLINSRGHRMELDGYSRELGLAFEYNGEQHYKQSRFFHRGSGELSRRRKDDARKQQLCKTNGVLLFEVPYTLTTQEIPAYIYSLAEASEIEVRAKQPHEIKVAEFVMAEQLRAMYALAKDRDGQCLSTAYVDSGTKLRWRCAEGHEWKAPPSAIRSGKWCRKCATVQTAAAQRSTIRDMHVVAKERGGKCLSSTYVNNVTKLLWQCGDGHEWEARPGSVKRGAWCPTCAGTKRLTIDQMHALAKERDGQCLSATYINKETKLRWQCGDGHEWEARPGSVKRGAWCPTCGTARRAATTRGTIEDMQLLAGRRNGKCVSSTYVSTHTKLLWRCADGHEWEATPSKIKNGRWCPVCARTRRGRRVS